MNVTLGPARTRLKIDEPAVTAAAALGHRNGHPSQGPRCFHARWRGRLRVGQGDRAATLSGPPRRLRWIAETRSMWATNSCELGGLCGYFSFEPPSTKESL